MSRRISHYAEGVTRLLGPRGRVIAQTGAWSIIAKACRAANLLFSIPFVLHALGPAQFGAWATLASFVGLVGFLDFGFGNGMMNLVAAARGRNASSEIATILNEGIRAIWGITVWLALGAVVALVAIPWHALLGLPESQSGVSRAAAGAVLATIVFAIPLNLASRAQLGLGRGDRTFRWQAAGQLVTLAAVIISARAGASLPVLTAVAIATPLVAPLANTIELYRSQLLGAAVLTRNLGIARHIRREGGLFFVLQLAAALAYSTDLTLISAFRGPTEAGTYAIVQRLFGVIPLAMSLLWVPLWPIYRQALAARDHDWVVRTLRRTLMLALLAAATGGIVMAFGFDPIVSLWIHRPLAVSGWMLAGFAIWYVIDAVGNGIATFLNAASIVRYQVIVATVFATLCLAGKAWGTAHFGAWVLPWIAAVAYCITVMIPTLYLAPRLIAQSLEKSY